MATATLPAPKPPRTAAPSIWPWTYRMTCEVFERLRHSGWVEGHKLILIDGEILEMAHPGPMHDKAVGRCEKRLRKVFPDDQFWIRVQMGMFFGINTDPLPDLAVIAETPETLQETPRSGLL